MPIIFGAFCPHPPIAIPNIGQDNLARLKKTLESYRRLADALAKAEVESLIVISPHGTETAENFNINFSPHLTGTLEIFGDLETKIDADVDLSISFAIHQANQNKFPVRAIARKEMDYGLTIPLRLMTGNKIPLIVALSPASLPAENNFNFGRFLSTAVQTSGKRVGFIASGDLSHCLSKEAPGGWNSKGKKFDQKVIECLEKKDYDGLVSLDEKLAAQAQECGWKSLLILLGAFSDLNVKPAILSYEFPFGVGYLCVNFELGAL